MTFAPDYPWAIVYPAHPTNWYDPANHGGVPNRPRAFCLHTPEEPAGDNYPGTPIWFAGANRNGSTHYFVEAIEDPNRPGWCKVYQCVPESFGAIANGKTPDKPWPAWADRSTSLNWQTLSIEIEGKAATIHLTMTPMQLRTVVHLIQHRAAAHGFPVERTFGHYEVSSQRTDPGALFPWAELRRQLAGGIQEDELSAAEKQELANQRARSYLIDWLLRDVDVVPIAEEARPGSALGDILTVEFRAADGTSHGQAKIWMRPDVRRG